MNSWREIGKKGEDVEKNWKKILNKKDNKIKEELERLNKGELPISLDKILGDEKLIIFFKQNQKWQRDNVPLLL